jgi:hypothetical protein
LLAVEGSKRECGSLHSVLSLFCIPVFLFVVMDFFVEELKKKRKKDFFVG